MDLDRYLDAEPAPAPHAAVAIKAARAKLNAPPRVRSVWPVMGAAAFAAASALTLAFAVIVGPPHFGPDLTVGGAEADGALASDLYGLRR